MYFMENYEIDTGLVSLLAWNSKFGRFDRQQSLLPVKGRNLELTPLTNSAYPVWVLRENLFLNQTILRN
jgi:hypothetical protein